MAWVAPKTDWSPVPGITDADLNRWEGNILELKKAATIDLADAGAVFTTDNVEAALQQIKNSLGAKIVGFQQDWNTNPYSMSATTQNSITGGIMSLTSTSADPMISMEAIGSFPPDIYRYIEIRYRVVSGGATNVELFFTNDRYTGANGAQVISVGLISDAAWHVLTVDCWTHADWKKYGNIRGWRYDWATANGITMELDYIKLISFGI